MSGRRTIDLQSAPYRPRTSFIQLESVIPLLIPDLHYKGKSFFIATQSKSSKPWVQSGDRTRVRAVALVTLMLKTSMSH